MRARTLSDERELLSLSPFRQSLNIAEPASNNIFNISNKSPNQFNNGIFDDILSPSGKVLSTVTVDSIHSSTYCDVTDVPVTDDIHAIENDALKTDVNFPLSVTDTFRTETFTNEDILKIKLTPTLMEFDDYLFGKLTPSLEDNRSLTPLFTNQEHLFTQDFTNQSSRSLTPLFTNQEHLFTQDFMNQSITQNIIYKSDVVVEESNLLPEQREDQKVNFMESQFTSSACNTNTSTRHEDVSKQRIHINKEITTQGSKHTVQDLPPKIIQVKKSTKNTGLYSQFLNLPAHYHAAIICFLLVAYNIIFNLYKQYYDHSAIRPTTI